MGRVRCQVSQFGWQQRTLAGISDDKIGAAGFEGELGLLTGMNLAVHMTSSLFGNNATACAGQTDVTGVSWPTPVGESAAVMMAAIYDLEGNS